MNTVANLLQGLVGIAFLSLGIAKLVDVAPIRAVIYPSTLPPGLRRGIGAVELLGGVALIGSILQPFIAFFAAALLAVVQIGALLAHLVRGPRQGWQVTAVLLVGVLLIGELQPLGLQVLALPKADALPVDPVANATVLKTYPAGMWFESVRVAANGTIFLAANQGLNLQTGDKRKVRAQVIARSKDGSERVFFELPAGATAGAMAFGHDGTMYMVGDGAARGVWRLTVLGKAELFAKLPDGAWPNGLDIGPDGRLYVSDSLLGLIWRIDPIGGKVDMAIESGLFRRRPFVALAPGANGLHFHGRDLYVAISDKGTLLKLHLGPDDKLSTPKVVATGVPGDDFAIDSRGVLYVTTHPFNTIVRITPDGRRSVVADARQGVIGATDAAFGVSAGDDRTLYVVTDGGAFAGNPAASGALVALKLH